MAGSSLIRRERSNMHCDCWMKAPTSSISVESPLDPARRSRRTKPARPSRLGRLSARRKSCGACYLWCRAFCGSAPTPWFQWDPKMARTCAELQCGVVLMHTRGQPHQWRDLPSEPDIVALLEHELANRVQVAFERGVRRERIVLDPGFGFGKNFEENYPLLARFHQLHRMGFPLLAGTSRKSFVGRTVGEREGRDAPPTQRLYGSLAAMVASILGGAHIVRVHDVKPAVEAAAVADEILAASGANTSGV